MATRLTAKQLNELFVADLGEAYCIKSEIEKKPLLISPVANPEIIYKVYIYNCTNPPGGRTLDEYKIQLILPDQGRGNRGHLDETDGTIILIVGFAIYDACENGVWVIWETQGCFFSSLYIRRILCLFQGRFFSRILAVRFLSESNDCW